MFCSSPLTFSALSELAAGPSPALPSGALGTALLATTLLAGLGLPGPVLGEVKQPERERVAQAAGYLLLKNALFVFYALGAETLVDLCCWLACLSLLKGLGEVCRQRVARLAHRPTPPTPALHRLCLFLGLTCGLTGSSFVLVVSAFSVPGLQSLLLLAYEPLHMGLELAQATATLGLRIQGCPDNPAAEDQGYLLGQAIEVAKLSLALLHTAHLLLNFLAFSVIDALLLAHMWHVAQQLYDKVVALRQYMTAVRVLTTSVPTATPEQESQYSNPCAICYDSLGSETLPGSADYTLQRAVKILPCGHMFHFPCIRQWMEHHPACPICKRSVLPCPTARPP